MTFSYTFGSGKKDDVRFLVGDTEATLEMYSDEEIAAALASFDDDAEKTALFLYEGLIARFSLRANQTTGQVSINYDNLMRSLKSRYDKLYARVNGAGTVYVGGISVSDKQAKEADTDGVKPVFKVGQFDNEGSDNA